MGHVRRTFRRVFWLIKSLLMKLTPARRILLAIALFLLIPGIHIGGTEGLRIDVQSPFLSIVIIVIILMLELKDKLVARDELEAGRAVQFALMPPDRPKVPGWDIWLYTQPANDVGGDLVDHLPLDEQPTALRSATSPARRCRRRCCRSSSRRRSVRWCRRFPISASLARA